MFQRGLGGAADGIRTRVNRPVPFGLQPKPLDLSGTAAQGSRTIDMDKSSRSVVEKKGESRNRAVLLGPPFAVSRI
jgi:hypothetical protein